MALLDGGVPYDVVMEMSDARRLAFVVAMGENKGGRFNWDDMRWEQTT